MNKFKLFILLAAFIAGQYVIAQQGFDFSREAVIERLKQDIYTLASDEYEGRDAGTPGEWLAAQYVRDRLQEIGLPPFFGDSYFQEFTFPGPWEYGEDNVLRIADKDFLHGEDFFSLPGSASASYKGMVIDVGYGVEGTGGIFNYTGKSNLDGKIFLMEYFMPLETDQEVELTQRELTALKLQLAREHGAAAILFKNSLSGRSDPRMDLRISMETLGIPVMFLKEDALMYLHLNMDLPVSLATSLHRQDIQSWNVAAYIDNGAATTVVIGGHYDHVGYGRRGSRSPGEDLIHYGADDNASGTAGMLEAARYFANASHNNHNYIFMAFGAEEKGLIGSRHFTTSDAYDMGRVNYMFNLDMIGRMNENQFTLIGTGSSPLWDELIDSKSPAHIEVRKSPGAMGGSDHTPFYMRDIPVLFFFTGMHEDYHRPTDTPDKINYDGAYDILTMMINMVKELDGRERVGFSKAPVADRGRQRSDSPAMGLMPDLTYDGEGLRVQAVIDDRPAKRAGLLDGDVIIRIGEIEVREIQTYMEAMGKLNPGNKATVVVKRGDEEVTVEVQL